MRSLNRVWRGKDRTTDVLSFPLREGKGGHILPDMLGDIVISVPAARRQAKISGHALDREIERLLVHGLVHLLGYDHERGARDAGRMERKERQLLKKLS
jgi:probable rRNA maturation factor